MRDALWNKRGRESIFLTMSVPISIYRKGIAGVSTNQKLRMRVSAECRVIWLNAPPLPCGVFSYLPGVFIGI
jgi:hypothetical protein